MMKRIKLHDDMVSYSERLKRIIDHSMDAVVVMDEFGMVQEWNPAAESIFGWTFSEIAKKPLHDTIIPVEFRQRHIQGIQRLVDGRQAISKAKRIESVGLHKDGHEFPIELCMIPVHDKNGWVFYAYIRDLTNKIKKDVALIKSEVLLQTAQRIAKLGCWEFDHVNQLIEWSDETYRIFGLDPEEGKLTYELFLSFIHPDDREYVQTCFAKSLSEKEDYDVIHRIVLKNGDEKIMHEQCTTTFDADGLPVHSLGIVQDITERVSTLDELRLAATAFDTHAGILITDIEGTIIRVNPAIEKMTGYSSDELIGENPRLFNSGKMDASFYRDMWRSVKDTGIWQGELWNKRKNGELYAEWLTITTVKDGYGQAVRYVATSQDITKRK